VKNSVFSVVKKKEINHRERKELHRGYGDFIDLKNAGAS